MRSQLRILRDPIIVGHVLLSVLVFTGMFTAYTYLADILGRLIAEPLAQAWGPADAPWPVRRTPIGSATSCAVGTNAGMRGDGAVAAVMSSRRKP